MAVSRLLGGRAPPASQVPGPRQQLERAPIEGVELHETLRDGEQARRVAQLVITDPERVQRVAAVGGLAEREDQGPRAGPGPPPAHEALAGGEQPLPVAAPGVRGGGGGYPRSGRGAA